MIFKDDLHVHLLTFATSGWKNYRSRFTQQVNNIREDFNFFDTTDILDETSLGSDWYSNCGKYKGEHGYALWSWKPYIIFRKLQAIDYNDVLVYMDGGCAFPKREILPGFLNLLRGACASIKGDELGCTVWMKNRKNIRANVNIKLLENFGLKDDNVFLDDTPHYQAGVLVIKKSDVLLRLIERWKHIVVDEFEKNILTGGFMDKTGQIRGYLRNGSDQAALQCLLYTMKFNVVNLSDLFYDNGVIAHIRN